MFDFFRNKGNQPETPDDHDRKAAYEPAPGTEIRFDPKLIEGLKADHKNLLGLYREIKAAFEEGDFVHVSALLGDFRTGLQGHLLTENVRLYLYLDHQMRGDDVNSDLIRGFRREMDGIGRTALNFLRKYEAIGVDQDLAKAFGRDLDALADVLLQRIEREESTLYPLYLPSY